MDTKENVIDLNNFPIGTEQPWKFGLITRSVYRKREDLFTIDDTSGGWVTAFITKEELIKLIEGKMSLLDLNWK